MFLMLCGADQNPNPRSKLPYVEQHGQTLAREVRRVLDGKLEGLKGETRAAFQMRDLPLAPHAREDFEKMSGDSNVYKARLAKEMLRLYDQRTPVRTVPYPVQALAFGRSLAIVALGGEVVVDYALQIKRKHPKQRIVVAGYSNDVMCYIPTARILKEGGYEPVDSMVYYGMPAPFVPEVEPQILQTVEQVLGRVGVR
jgi:neutral ceramidase